MNVKTQRRVLGTAIVTKQERSMGNNQDRKDLKSKKQKKMPTYVHMIHTQLFCISMSRIVTLLQLDFCQFSFKL